MTTNKTNDVGPLEMKTLGIIEGKDALSVSQIQNLLKGTGDTLAYTTVLTVLVRLYNKGYLARHKEGRQYMYAIKSRGNPSQKLFDKIRRTLFQGERLKPILSLLGSENDLTREELLELKRQVDERIKQHTTKS